MKSVTKHGRAETVSYTWRKYFNYVERCAVLGNSVIKELNYDMSIMCLFRYLVDVFPLSCKMVNRGTLQNQIKDQYTILSLEPP